MLGWTDKSISRTFKNHGGNTQEFPRVGGAHYPINFEQSTPPLELQVLMILSGLFVSPDCFWQTLPNSHVAKSSDASPSISFARCWELTTGSAFFPLESMSKNSKMHILVIKPVLGFVALGCSK